MVHGVVCGEQGVKGSLGLDNGRSGLNHAGLGG